MCSKLFLLPLLSGSVYLALCWGLWSTQSWVLYKVINLDLFAFFCMWPSSLTRTICWRCSFFPVCISAFFIKTRCPLCLDLWLSSGHQHVYFYANVMLFSLLLLCSTTWDQGMMIPSVILWLFRIVVDIMEFLVFGFPPHGKLKLSFQVLWRIVLEF